AQRRGEHQAAALDRRREGRREVVRRARARRRPRRQAQPPPGGALGWSAAARRDRTSARLPSHGPVRRRADGQPRLQDRRRDPRSAASLGEGTGPDDGHGHPRRARGGDRRSSALPCRRPDREGERRHELSRDRRGDGAAHDVTKFALKGLLTRKLRTALTAIAIVLGVATVSGTFVLTDSIDQAFDSIFSDIYKGTDATITSKSAFDVGDGSGTT